MALRSLEPCYQIKEYKMSERRKYRRFAWDPLPAIKRWADDLPDLTLSLQEKYELQRIEWRKDHAPKDIKK